MNRNYSLRAAVERVRAAGPVSEDLELILRKIERIFDGYKCVVCGNDAHAFMVHDTIWAQARFKPYDLACLPCVEARLGRALKIPEDFQTTLRMNAEILWAVERALLRLGKP